MVASEVWTEAGAGCHWLCIGCLEERLDRTLTPGDFPALPLNDDDEQDSVRLRTRKGSGRRVEALYGIGRRAVIELGDELVTVAETLGLDPSLLAVWVKNCQRRQQLEEAV